jgi:hypothetical protein
MILEGKVAPPSDHSTSTDDEDSDVDACGFVGVLIIGSSYYWKLCIYSQAAVKRDSIDSQMSIPNYRVINNLRLNELNTYLLRLPVQKKPFKNQRERGVGATDHQHHRHINNLLAPKSDHCVEQPETGGDGDLVLMGKWIFLFQNVFQKWRLANLNLKVTTDLACFSFLSFS